MPVRIAQACFSDWRPPFEVLLADGRDILSEDQFRGFPGEKHRCRIAGTENKRSR